MRLKKVLLWIFVIAVVSISLLSEILETLKTAFHTLKSAADKNKRITSEFLNCKERYNKLLEKSKDLISVDSNCLQ